jgi:hypothetical protein
MYPEWQEKVFTVLWMFLFLLIPLSQVVLIQVAVPSREAVGRFFILHLSKEDPQLTIVAGEYQKLKREVDELVTEINSKYGIFVPSLGFCFVLFCFVLFCFVLFCFVLFWCERVKLSYIL